MVKVFLVEDEAIIRRGIRDNIDWASHGFEFAGEAGDGEYAYPLILKAQPDILVTDIKMPFMDGLELSRLVKKALPRTRIIVLSGYNEFEYAKEAIQDRNQRLSAKAGILGGTHRCVEKGGGRDPGREGKIKASGEVFCQLRKIYGISGQNGL